VWSSFRRLLGKKATKLQVAETGPALVARSLILVSGRNDV
jgi:hypothetical protein